MLLQARDPIEALRLRAHRLKVYRKGRLLADSPKVSTRLHLAGRGENVSFQPD